MYTKLVKELWPGRWNLLLFFLFPYKVIIERQKRNNEVKQKVRTKKTLLTFRDGKKDFFFCNEWGDDEFCHSARKKKNRAKKNGRKMGKMINDHLLSHLPYINAHTHTHYVFILTRTRPEKHYSRPDMIHWHCQC